MNFRNCKYFSEMVNIKNQVWSQCSISPQKSCPLYHHRDSYPYRCLGFEPTFKAMMEEVIIEAENRPQ